MKMKKHIVSMLLVLILALSILPMAAFAAPAEESNLANLQSLLVHTGFSISDKNVLLKNPGDRYSTDVVFDPATLEYTLPAQSDTQDELHFRAKPANAGDKVILHYGEKTKDITFTYATQYAYCLNPGRNVLKLEVVPAEGSGRVSTTYTLNVDCVPCLGSLSATADSPVSWDEKFVYTKHDYNLTIPATLDKLVLNATPRFKGAEVTFNGQKSGEVALDGISKIEVKVSIGEVSNIYTLNLVKVAAENFRLNVASPVGATVRVYGPTGEAVKPNADGSYTGLFSRFDYTYTVTAYGYVAKNGVVPADGGTLNVTLDKAPDRPQTDVTAYWPNFRGNDFNMAITDTLTPIDPANTSLKWNQKLGGGWSSAPSVQIIVDDSLIVMCCDGTITKMDLQTGDILAEADMVADPDWGYTPPAYGDGMIFCPLGRGTIQAFDAKTLESLWVYQAPLAGQALSPITYSDGYIYTGFWNSEVANANFVCLSVTDEDPTKTDETKVATWVHTQKGGFYWAGSVAVGNAIIVGTDDGVGRGGSSHLYAFDKLTGEVISDLELTNAGDQRSSIAYDAASGRVYFSTKGGYLCRANVNSTTGAVSELKMVNNGDQSTSTPVIYKGKVFYATGRGPGAPGRVVVADAESLEALYSVELKAYPQCSLLLSSTYEASTGYIYLYATYNGEPGGISMIKIDPTKDTVDGAELIELYDAAGFSQYCITSIICGPDGTLYYKNDSCNVLAVGTKRWTCVETMIDGIKDVTMDSEAAIVSARNAYNSLSAEDQGKVANYNKLTEAEEKLAELKKNHADEIAANAVVEKIDAIGTVDLNSTNVIDAAREAYKALTEEQKNLVTNYEVLVAAEEKLAELEKNHADEIAANAVVEKIDAIGTVDRNSTNAIGAAREAYNALTQAQKDLVHNYSVLLEAEAAMDGMVPPTGDSTNLRLAFVGLTLGLLGCVATVLAYTKKKAF